MIVRTEASVGDSPGWLVAEWAGHGVARGMMIGFVYPGLAALIAALAMLPTWIFKADSIIGGLGAGLFIGIVGGLFGLVVGGAIGLVTGLVISVADLLTLRRLHPSVLAGALVGVALSVITVSGWSTAEQSLMAHVAMALLYGGPFMLGLLSLRVFPIRRRVLPAWTRPTPPGPVRSADHHLVAPSELGRLS